MPHRLDLLQYDSRMIAPPRSDLDTHRVTNQPAPLVDVNLFDADALLSPMATAAE